jgi:nitroreductase
MQIDPLFIGRSSAFGFNSDKKIPDDALKAVFEAAQWAPSAFNEQPWRFIYFNSDDKQWDSVVDKLVAPNQIWARHASYLIFAAVKKTFSHNEQLNGKRGHDLGLATSQLILQASLLGIQSHIMGGFQIDAMESIIKLPQEYELWTCIALGYPGETPDPLKEKVKLPRIRKELNDIIFHLNFP